jgi:hypothetical protein
VISPVIFQQDTSQNLALAADPNSNGVSQFSLRFREIYTMPFQKRNIATSAADPAALADQNDLTLGEYHTESGFYKSSLTIPFSLRPAGVADSGTRLMARFFQVPAGVLLFARFRRL